MSLSFSLGIGVTEVYHQTWSVEVRTEPKPPRIDEQRTAGPIVNTGSRPNCRSVDLDKLSRIYDKLIWERMTIEDRRLPRHEKKKKKAELDLKVKQLEIFLNKHRHDVFDEGSYQNLIYREKCYDF